MSDATNILMRNEIRERSIKWPIRRMNKKIQIGISSLIGVKRAEELLSRFKAKRPDVELVYHERSLDELQTIFDLGNADIIIAPQDSPIQPTPDCLRFPFMLEQLVFVPRSAYRQHWETIDCVTVNDIAAENFVLLPDKCGLTRTTQRLFASQGHTIRAHETPATSYQLMLDWIDASLCSGILPDSKVKGYRGVVIPIVDNGRPVAIEYIVFGRLPAVAPQLFTELWDCLLESRIALGHSASGNNIAVT